MPYWRVETYCHDFMLNKGSLFFGINRNWIIHKRRELLGVKKCSRCQLDHGASDSLELSLLLQKDFQNIEHADKTKPSHRGKQIKLLCDSKLEMLTAV